MPPLIMEEKRKVGRKGRKYGSLATEMPEMLSEWDYEKNDINPDSISLRSSIKVWWVCKNNNKHKWEASTHSRTNGRGCPYCNGKKVIKEESLASLYPELMTEWDFTKNEKLDPFEITPKSDKRAWWKCNINPEHVWDCLIKNRTARNSGCPYCDGKKASNDNSLASLFPNIAAEWHPTKNGDLSPNNITSGSKKRVWWMCQQGHEYRTFVHHRTRNNSDCKKCYSQRVSGDGSPFWKGGITPLHENLRNKIYKWKMDSIESCKGICVLSGEPYHDIHHLYGFDLILEELLIETSINVKTSISEYSAYEMELLANKCLEIHYRYPLGVCLREDIHNLFHSIFGYGRNTPEQFEEFKQRYISGEFDNILHNAS